MDAQMPEVEGARDPVDGLVDALLNARRVQLRITLPAD